MRTFFRLPEPLELMPLAKGTRSHTISSELIEYFLRYYKISADMGVKVANQFFFEGQV